MMHVADNSEVSETHCLADLMLTWAFKRIYAYYPNSV